VVPVLSEPKETKCQRCGCEIEPEDQYNLNGQIVCDDCYIEESSAVKTCNPLAVYSAKCMQSETGSDPTANLTALQKQIYDFIKASGKTTTEELCSRFSLTNRALGNQLAILRHLELTKGKKEGKQIYIVPF
jgi:predicted HTH transcriptional regulator